MDNLHSAIYKGWVRHRRYQPKAHAFRYQVFMMYLDLAELDRVFNGTRLWSAKTWALARFKREDFLGDPGMPLDEAVRRKVEEQTGNYPTGPIRMLANLRYFGFQLNPICCYYCFDKDERLQAIVAEVNNTPWDEKHSYVLKCEPEKHYQRITFNKSFHVSPFNPMDIDYGWRSSLPDESLHIHMQNHRNEEVEFDATVALKRYEISPGALRSAIIQYPMMTLKVALGIYWQALKLFFKRVPIYTHPASEKAGVVAK